MNLTPHFTLEELTNTSHISLVQSNRMSAENSECVMKALHMTAELLEQIREVIDCPMTITSGFRMPVLNKSVGGSPTSKHTQGLCADFIPIGMPVAEAFFMIMDKKDKIPNLRKCIIEGVKGKTWIHVQSKVSKEEGTNFYATTDGKTYKEIV